MLKTRIKASAIANLTDARYFAAWDVDWVGFSLEPDAVAYTSPETMQAIREWIEGPAIIGEFNASTADEIRAQVDAFQLDGVQVGLFHDLGQVRKLENIPIIRETVVDSFTTIDILTAQCRVFERYVECFLLEFTKNRIDWATLENGTLFSLQDLQQLCSDYPILLSIDIPSGRLQEVLDTLKPYGLSIFGGTEEKVGYKSFDELDEIFEGLEAVKD